MLSAVDRFHVLYDYYKSLSYAFLYVYFYTCISGLAAAILDFLMHSNTNNKDISNRQSRETEL